jgi:hypothetical protein
MKRTGRRWKEMSKDRARILYTRKHMEVRGTKRKKEREILEERKIYKKQRLKE